MSIIKTSKLGLMAALAAGTIVGCSTTPEVPSAVQDARAEYDRLAAQGYAQRHAAEELDDAEQAVALAEEAWRKDTDELIVNHYAYLAERRVAIAEEAAERGRAEATIEEAELERQQVMLEIREAEATRAQARAQQAELRNKELEQSLAGMQNEMETLKTETTNEGIVLTLQDILFATNEAQLKSSADRTLDRVATFLNNYQNRELEIKGYTDSTGSAEYNQGLSERRAQSVEQALVVRGVDPERIETEGFGEEYPVADNDTSVGRQQNRRVEILIANPE